MIRAAIGAMAILLPAAQRDTAAPEPAPRADVFAQLIIHQQIIIRVPGGVRSAVPATNSLTQWRETRGPHCIAAHDVLGATMLSASSVDLVMRDSSRIRARLEQRCPALDYYYGFYVNATPDGQICANRDSIRSRMGGECGIDAFHSLHPVLPH